MPNHLVGLSMSLNLIKFEAMRGARRSVEDSFYGGLIYSIPHTRLVWIVRLYADHMVSRVG
jgi:hypothetical protein